MHSLHTHVYALLRMAKECGVRHVFLHPFFDGRDTPPRSGIDHLKALLAEAGKIGAGEVATVIGRYYAMDRDNRWDRVERAYKAMVRGEGKPFGDPVAAGAASYEAGTTDEFIEPVVIVRDGMPVGRISPATPSSASTSGRPRPGDHPRADPGGVRPVSRPWADPAVLRLPDRLRRELRPPVAFPPQTMDGILACALADGGLRNLRIAETEKYAHVTYFFNGGEEKVFPASPGSSFPPRRWPRTT